MTFLERLALATGPSRELDAEIAVRFQPHLYVPKTPASDMKLGHLTGLRDGKPYASVQAPHFTGSMDAAFTLIPEGWSRQGFISWPAYDEGRFVDGALVELRHDVSSGGGPKVRSCAKTIPLALCSAAIQAIEMMGKPPADRIDPGAGNMRVSGGQR